MTPALLAETSALYDFNAMGTSCRVVLAVPDPAAALAARRWVAGTAASLTRFAGDSELMSLNRRAGAWVEVSRLLAELLEVALWAYERSDGLVHAGVLPALLAAGYRRDFALGPECSTSYPPPPPPLPEMLIVRGRRVRLRPGSAVDLGGLAKGWMADQLAVRLEPAAVVNLGGDLRAAGEVAWPIDFAGRVLALRDEGAATSSVRHRRWRRGDGWTHHLIDPRTGKPSASGVAQVQVVAASALEAEVLAKQALLLGPEGGRALLARRARAWRLEPEA